MSSISGYKELSERKLSEINHVKDFERKILSFIDSLQSSCAETRWLNIGKTQIELGCMSLVKAICKEDESDENA